MVCMESPAVDFKVGILTGNENEGDVHTSAGGFKNLNTDTVEYLIFSLQKNFNDLETEKIKLVPQIAIMEKEVLAYKDVLNRFDARLNDAEKIYNETMFRVGSDSIATMKARLLVLERDMKLLNMSIQSMQKNLFTKNTQTPLVCMESPAVDFKAGIFTCNEHENFVDRSDEALQALTAENYRLNAENHRLNAENYRLNAENKDLREQIGLRNRMLEDFQTQITKLEKKLAAVPHHDHTRHSHQMKGGLV